MDTHKHPGESPQKPAPATRVSAPSQREQKECDVANLFDAPRSAPAAPPRMRAVKGTPNSLNEITVDQLVALDPEGGPDGDWANAVIITLMIGPATGISRADITRQLMADFAESHEEDTPAARRHEKQRIDRTITNMVERGVLVERDGQVRSNIDIR